MSVKRGVFIVFEGCDGTGKTTQTKRLVESGILGEAKAMVFPDRTTPVGQLINQYLKKEIDFSDQTIHLLYTANRWEVAAEMEKLLSSGISIVCDRYWFSGTAYSSAKGTVSLEWCTAAEAGLPVPDMVIMIDIDPKLLLERKGFGEERYEKLDFQTKVRDAFLRLKDDTWHLLDGSKPLDAITEDINNLVKNYLAKQ